MAKEDLSVKERLEFAKTVNRGRKDPIWFLEEIVGWKTMFPMQKEIIKTFYQNKYDPSLPKYKKLVARCGQRCALRCRIATSNGLIYVEDLYNKDINKDGNINLAIDLGDVEVYNGEKWTKAESIVYAGKKQVCKLVTEYGFVFECSEDHKFLVYDGDSLEWKPFKDIEIGKDYIELSRGITPPYCNNNISDEAKLMCKNFVNENKTTYTLPIEISTDLAIIMGMLIADGSICNEGKIWLTKGDPSIIEYYVNAMKNIFGLECVVRSHSSNDTTKNIEVYSESVRYFLYSIGLEFGRSMTKTIPSCILNGSKDLKVAFLSGYFSCDGNVQESKSRDKKKCRVTALTVSKKLVYELQNLLLELGILSSISIGKSVEFSSRIKRDNDAYTLNIFGREILKFYSMIKLVSISKQSIFDRVYESQCNKMTRGDLIPLSSENASKYFKKDATISHVILGNSKSVDKTKIYNLYKGGSDILDRVFDKNRIYVKVKSKEYTEEVESMYDLYVPEGNCYVANGFLTHNSGKTVLGSKIAVYEFFELISLDSPAEHYGLLKGGEIGINCLASSKDIALEGMFSIMRNDIQSNEWFNQWFNLKVTEGRISCDDKNVYAKTVAARADAGSTGSTSKLALLDEVDLFQRTESKLGSEMVISKAINSTQSLGLDGKFVAISSTQYTDGAISKLYYDGLNEPSTLTYNLPTWLMNTKLTKELLMEEYKYKMHMFWRDFANQPEVSGGLMFPNGVKFNKSLPNVFFADDQTIDEYSNHFHVCAIDPGFRNDAFGIAVGYVEGDTIVINGARKYSKEFETDAFIKPSDIEHEIERWVERLNITTLLYDCDIVLNIIEKAQDQWGIDTVKNIVGEKEYGMWLSLNDGIGEFNLNITYDEYAKREAEQLIKSQLPSGKIRVDHPYSGSKDVCDAICNTIYFLSQNQTGQVWAPVGHMAPMY